MNRTGDWREAGIQKPQLKKTTSQSAERGEERSGKEKGKKVKRAGKEERKERGERREKGKKGKEERRPVTSTQTLHCESLLPSTAFQCKHRHPICDRVNWFFDVSRKVLIEGRGGRRGRLFLSPQTPVYLFKKKILTDSKELPFVPS